MAWSKTKVLGLVQKSYFYIYICSQKDREQLGIDRVAEYIAAVETALLLIRSYLNV